MLIKCLNFQLIYFLLVDILPSDGHLHYENYYQTNPLATKKRMLLNERDRRAHLARKFSINHSPSFSLTSHYSLKYKSDILPLTLVYFENTIPLPFMHSYGKRYRYIWAKQRLERNENFLIFYFNLNHVLNQFLI